MTDEQARSFLPLHPEAFRILVILKSGERHGYALVKELERDPGRPGKVLPANLYRRIRTLLEQGLIGEVVPARSEEEDRRRYFAVTPLGEAVARAEAERMRALLIGAGDLLGSAGP
jgi:DNA-binding PadR family transcriptional regulator